MNTVQSIATDSAETRFMPKSNVITVEGVSHRFSETVVAVENMSFDVREGEFVSIVGPSGCGKTTILNIAAGLLPLQEGEILISGKPPLAGRRDIAYMFAQDALLPWRTILGNALFGAEMHNGGRSPPPDVVERAKKIISEVGLGGFEDHYPRQLSHGMRQRTALSRTFLMESSILFMDEPFGALDAHTKLMLEAVLLKLWEKNNRTVLFITHDLAEAVLLSDRILVCSARPGKIKADVTIDLPRPRIVSELQKDDKYHHYYQRIWQEIRDEMKL